MDIDLERVERLLAEMENVPFDMSGFQIETMVLDGDEPERKYQKTLLQINNCITNLIEARFRIEELNIDTEELKFKFDSSETTSFDKRRHAVQIERNEWSKKAQVKLLKECGEQLAMYETILASLPKPTRSQFEAAEPEYWKTRIIKDSIREVKAVGRIQTGTQASLERLGVGFEYDPSAPNGVKFIGDLPKSLQVEDKTIASIHEKLAEIQPYVAVLVPKRTMEEPEVTDWKNHHYPNGMAIKFGRVAGPLVEANRETLLHMAIEAKSKYAFFVDTDNKLNPDTISKFVTYMDAHEDVAMLSAFSFHKNQDVPVPMNVVDGTILPVLPGQGIVKSNWCTGMPAVIIRIEALKDLKGPFFACQRVPIPEDQKKDGNDGIIVGEDTYFCRKLLDAGLKVLIDTNEIVEHIGVKK